MKRFFGPLTFLLALLFVIALSAYVNRGERALETDYFKRVSAQGHVAQQGGKK